MRYIYSEYRTVVAVVGGVTVTGVLPGTAWEPEGSVAVSGDVHLLRRDQARELAEALQLVADRLEASAERATARTQPPR